MKFTTFKKCFVPGLVLVVFSCSSQATDPFWINSATITFPPQIDASNVVNSGTIQFNTSLPFESSNTRNYTNSGTITCSPGWLFDDVASNTGLRRPSDNFVNLNGGTISALDAGGAIFGLGPASSVSYLWVSASNIVSKGTLGVGGSGWLKITGTNVNLARSALEVTSLQGTGSPVINGTNYLNDVGISDIWWGQTNGLTFNSAAVYNGNMATAPPHLVQQGPGGPFFLQSFTADQPFAFGYSNATDFAPLTLTNSDGSLTNVLAPTNIIKQAVFVSVSDPSVLSASVSFSPSSSPTNPFQTVSVRLSLESTNVITGSPDTVSLYFYDALASETNRGLIVNLGNSGLPPFLIERPANYSLSRIDDGRFAAGLPGNVTPDASFLYDPATFTNAVVTGEYAGYAARIDNIASAPVSAGSGNVTNLPGRIQIFANNLDFSNTRVRGEGEVVVTTPHLLSSSGAAVDCENLSYTLGSTNGNLNVVGLTKQSVNRLKGDLLAWSGLWSNQMTFVYTNNYVVTNTFDTNGNVIGTNAVASPITNTASVGLYALILDGQGLIGRVPVATWDLVIHSTNVVISDSLSVVQSLLLDGKSLTLYGTLALSSSTLQSANGTPLTTSLNHFVSTNAPGLIDFTNYGNLSVPDEAHFGDDRPTPLDSFVNNGTVNTGSLDVDSLVFEDTGNMTCTVGPLALTGSTGEFLNGTTSSGGDVDLSFNDLKFLNHSISCRGALNLIATNAVSDLGAGSSNVFTIQNGFNLLRKPSIGDLLGTTFLEQAPNFVEVDHVWAGNDRGPTAAGYSDNVALGQLVLTTRSTTAAQMPLLVFKGATSQNGLYVDLLDLSNLGSNYLAMLQIDPNLTIYYAAAKVGFIPPLNSAGLPQEPEEFLDGQFGGRLKWVSGFAGPNSSVFVVANGATVTMNRALRFSKIIDSDGDGIPNFYDPTPLGGSNGGSSGFVLGPSLVNRTASQIALSITWTAGANTSYSVESTTNLSSEAWQLVMNYTNTSPIPMKTTVSDTNNVGEGQRFYRVRLLP